MKKNKTISLILCVSLITSPLLLQADGFSQNFSNVTSPTTIEGDDTAYYGGNVEYRFNNEMSSYSPWMDLQAPSIKAGCNGFSANGGFASFLDLDEIAQQLGSASGALMWGLLVGIVNSMPTLEHVFSKIKGWIQWLQDLVRNACNVGSNISGNLMTSTGFFSNAQKYIDKPGDWVDGHIDKVKDGVTEFLGDAGKVNPVGNGRDDVSKSYGASIYGTIYFIRGKVGDFLYDEFIKSKKDFPSDDEARKKLRQFTDETIKGKDDEETQYLLFANIFGEEAISDAFIKFIDEKGSIIPDLIALGRIDDAKNDTPPKENAASKKTALEREANQTATTLAGSVEGNPEVMKQVLATKLLPPPNISTDFLRRILKGDDSKKLELYPVDIIHSQVMDKGGVVYSLLAAKSFNKNKITIDWIGLEKESKKQIECTLKKTACSSSIGVKLIAPGAKKILETIAYTNAKEKANGKVKGDFGPQASVYIDELAKTNARFFAKYMLENLIDKWFKNSAGNKNAEGVKTQKEVQQILKDYIKEMDEGLKNDKQYIKDFEAIDKRQQTERTQK